MNTNTAVRTDAITDERSQELTTLTQKPAEKNKRWRTYFVIASTILGGIAGAAGYLYYRSRQ